MRTALFAVLCCLAACLVAEPAWATANATMANGKTPAQYRTFIAYFENDLFAGTDQHYTNAVKFTWLTKDVTEYQGVLPDWMLPTASSLPFVRDSGTPEQGVYHNVGISIGQNIYTPEDTQAEGLQKDDRPYAGWLYGAVALHRKTVDRLDTMELTLGMIGPSALSEQSQNTVHTYRDIPTAKGWDNQLRDEPGAMLSWQQNRRSWLADLGHGWGTDLIPHYGATVGNVMTYANAGGEMRFGWHLPKDFGASLISPGNTVTAPVVTDNGERLHGILDDFGWHVFLGTDGRAVARNAFIEGNTWHGSHGRTLEHLQVDVYGGISFIYKRIRLTYTHCLRTKEFEGQDKNQMFGSLSLAVTF